MRASRPIEWGLAVIACAATWFLAGNVAEVTSYFAAKAYYDAQVQGQFDATPHVDALAFAINSGARAGAVLGAIGNVIFYFVTKDKFGWKGLPLAMGVGIVVGSFAGYGSFGSFPLTSALAAMLASGVVLACALIWLFRQSGRVSVNKLSVLFGAVLVATLGVQFAGLSLAQNSQAQFEAGFGVASPQAFCGKIAEQLAQLKHQRDPSLDLGRLRDDELRKCLAKH